MFYYLLLAVSEVCKSCACLSKLMNQDVWGYIVFDMELGVSAD